jgi:hypothetical protein
MDNSILIAATNGNVELLNWYEKNGYKSKISTFALRNSYNNGHHKVLEWITKSIYPLNEYNRRYLRCYIPLKILSIIIRKIFIKKVIKWIDAKGINIKGIKFKTKNNYIKGYNKN